MDVTAQFEQEVARASAAHLTAEGPSNDQGVSSTRLSPVIAPPGPQQLKDAKNARQAYAEIRARLSAVEAYVSRTYPAYTAVAPLLWSEVRFGLSEGERDAIDDQLAKMVHEASRCIDGLAKITARSSSSHTNAGSDSHVSNHDSSSSSTQESGSISGSHSSKEQWTGCLPPPSTHGMAKEHARGAVAALLARLAALTDTIAAMQAARYASAREVSTTPFSSWLALKVGQSASSTKLKTHKDGTGSSSQKGFLTGPGSALARNPPPPTSSSWEENNGFEENFINRGSKSRKNNYNDGTGTFSSSEDTQLSDDLHGGGGRHFDRWLLQHMCPPSARHTFKLPDSTPEAISEFVEVERGRERVSAAHEAHETNNSSGNSSSSGNSKNSGLTTASKFRKDVVSSSTVVPLSAQHVGVVAGEGSSNARLSRSLLLESKPAVSTGVASEPSAAVIDEAKEEAALVQQQLVEEHAALESQRAAGDLDAVLMTEEKMRAVAEVMSMFSTKLAEQTEDVGAIFDQTEAVGDDVQQGHEQLLKAAESRRKARRLYVILTFALSIALLMADAVFD